MLSKLSQTDCWNLQQNHQSFFIWNISGIFFVILFRKNIWIYSEDFVGRVVFHLVFSCTDNNSGYSEKKEKNKLEAMIPNVLNLVFPFFILASSLINVFNRFSFYWISYWMAMDGSLFVNSMFAKLTHLYTASYYYRVHQWLIIAI